MLCLQAEEAAKLAAQKEARLTRQKLAQAEVRRISWTNLAVQRFLFLLLVGFVGHSWPTFQLSKERNPQDACASRSVSEVQWPNPHSSGYAFFLPVFIERWRVSRNVRRLQAVVKDEGQNKPCSP